MKPQLKCVYTFSDAVYIHKLYKFFDLFNFFFFKSSIHSVSAVYGEMVLRTITAATKDPKHFDELVKVICSYGNSDSTKEVSATL